MKTKILSILALLLTMTHGAWADDKADYGVLNGEFSVSAVKKVHFSRGNLRAYYHLAEVWAWSFATNQYDYVGYADGSTLINGNGTLSSTNHFVDLFCWSTNATYYGIHNSTENSTYSGSFKDWGTNAIINGGNKANIWYTPSQDEWTYLMNTRSGSTVGATANARYTYATINTDGTSENGMILFPDGVTFEASEATTWGTINNNSNWTTKCTTDQWAALEAKGCVFLPTAGWRSGADSGGGAEDRGRYWLATAKGDDSAYSIFFGTASGTAANDYYRRFGRSVRLVIESHTITYNANGGTGSVDVLPKYTGLDRTLSDGTGLSREGYTFAGWNTKADGSGTSYAAGGSYTTNDDIVLYAQWLAGEGTEASPYLIASTTDWNNLVSAVNGGETYSGTYFKMTANVGTVSTWMTGTFSGTFDGDGKTLTVGYSNTTADVMCAPFGTLNGASIQKLKVAGSISSNQRFIAGIAAWCSSTGNNVTNCLVSATINSSYSGNAADGGLVSLVDDGASLNVTGCAFAGKMLTTNGTTSCGGIVGWRRSSGTVTITNCLYAPTSATGSETWIASAEGENGSANFCRWNSSEPTITNCYYTTDFGSGSYTAQGLQARTIAAGDYVSSLSVTKGDATATYTVSGITVYSNGVDYNSTFYGGSGQTVSLDLTAETRTGYQFKQYAASQGSLSGETTDTPTLTMPAANSTANDVVTISAEYDPTYNATFADASDASNGWSISPTSGIVGSTVTVRYEGENKVKSVTVAPKGALTGKFSVSSTKQVQFSKGNLQYDGSAWSFHTNQYDIFGASQSDDHRDLFGWGTKTNPNNTSTTNGDYSWAEWGENTITNGCMGWRTLTKDEWGYLFTDRTNASTLRTFATVNNVTGLIVMPDGWTVSGVTLTITTANYTTNVLSTSQWATLEKQGCVFLPAAGGRAGTNVVNVGSIGDYWSSDASGETNAYDLNFSNNHLLPQNTAGQRHYGWSVRLVRDVE